MPEKNLQVGVLDIEPFSYHQNGFFQGIAYELWAEIASLADIKSEYTAIGPDINNAISEVQAGKYDVAIGPIGILANRIKKVDYTIPFFNGEFRYVLLQSNSSFWNRFNDIFSGYAPLAIFCFFGIFFIFILLIILIEHEHEELKNCHFLHNFGRLSSKFILNIFSGNPPIVTSKYMASLVVFLWLLIVNTYIITTLAGITATLVSKPKHFNNPVTLSDIQRLSTVVYGGNTALQNAHRSGLSVTMMTRTPEDAFNQVLQQQGSGAYMLYGVIQQYLFLHPQEKEKFYITPIKFPKMNLAFIINKKNRDFLPKINWAMAKIIEEGKLMNICHKYANIINEENCH